MLAQLPKLIPFVVLQFACVCLGTFFISEQLMPSKLASVYAATSFFSRTVITSVTVFAVSNFMGGWLMATFPPALASPTMIAVYVLMLVVSTSLVKGEWPSLWIVPATFAVMASCVWVSLLLGKS